MRIAVASSGLGHVARGVEAWACDLAAALAARKVEVRLYKGGGQATYDYERVIPCWQRGGCQARRLLRLLPPPLAWRLGLGSDYAIEQATFTLRLLSHLRQQQADILHVQDPLIALWVQRAYRAGVVPTRVVLGHGTEEDYDFIRRIDYLQHLAPWHMEEARAAGVYKPTWTAIPNFIDTESFSPAGPSLRAELGLPDDALVVLTVAAIKRLHKRVDHLLDEFARLLTNRPELPAWLVVAGGWEPQTDELIEAGRERLGDRVKFLVRFPRAKMNELYRTADLFVLCSLKEMMPIALVEATASGLPCLTHTHPVLRWITGPGGESIDMTEPGGLCKAMAGLLDDEQGRRSRGAQARSHCVQNFGRQQVVGAILDYYHFMLTHDRAMRAGAAYG